MTEKLIPYDKSIIVAADISATKLRELVQQTSKVKGIGGYKVAIDLLFEQPLSRTVNEIREFTDLPIIYDHQKGGCDTADVAEKLAQQCKQAGVNAVILFPLAGPQNEKDWIRICQDKGLTVIIGGHMIHPQFFTTDGGWMSPESVVEIFTIAAEAGVRNFVVPGSEQELIQKYTTLFTKLLGANNFSVFLPRIPTDPEGMKAAGQIAGDSWHGIIGRAITQATDISAAAEDITRQIPLLY
jgi:orotidine-5'-phosphate decarboxylase